MIIKSIAIQNIKSIGEKISISFEEGANIFIGPNGGGKSNLMDILHITLNTYFIWHWQEEIQEFGRIRYRKMNLENFFDLPIHDIIRDGLSQEIEINLSFSDDDINNIKILKENLEKISNQERDLFRQQKSDIENIFKPLLENKDILELLKNRNQKFVINAKKLNDEVLQNSFQSFNEEKKYFVDTLITLKKLST